MDSNSYGFLVMDEDSGITWNGDLGIDRSGAKLVEITSAIVELVTLNGATCRVALAPASGEAILKGFLTMSTEVRNITPPGATWLEIESTGRRVANVVLDGDVCTAERIPPEVTPCASPDASAGSSPPAS